MALKYPPFAACAAMEQAAKNAPPLRWGARGVAVALLQSALIQTGEKLPKSTKKTGVPDGDYGEETQQAVSSYQRKIKARPDGVAGEKTIKALDAAMVKATPVPSPSPSVPPPLPSTPDYEVGTGDPALGHDPGAGVWNSKPW